MKHVVAAVVLAVALGACGPSLPCEERSLPSPTPGYADTLIGLVVTPARASMREASARERETFERFTVDALEACEDASAPAADCAIGTLRTELRALAAPDHGATFTDIDDGVGPSLDSAHGEFAADARDCGGRAETACDAWLVGRAFARALCELREAEGD
jgi:hypothetical protein